MVSQPVWVEIHVSDVGRSEAFYAALAGWSFEPLEGMPPKSYRMIANTESGSVGGALVGGFPERVGGGGTIVYIDVADLDASVGLALSLGGRREAAHQVINAEDGRFAVISDPDGNLVGLWAPN